MRPTGRTTLLASLIKRPEGQLVATFAGLILLGTVVLALPVCHASDRVTLLDAFFTATSAVCVTGLTTRDTAADFTRTGQAVILVLIELGALGVMTFGAVAVQLFRWQLSLGSQAVLHDAFFQGQLRGNLVIALRRILLLTVGLEALGALLIYVGLQGTGVSQRSWFDALFLSISAFCNAGFSVYPDSAISLRGSPLIVWTLMGLIVCGGLGYIVLAEIASRTWRRLRRQRGGPVNWSLHTRTAVTVSAGLTAGGALLLMVTGLTPDIQGWSQYLLNALFQSVTARTAGFNTVEIGQLPAASLMVLIPLMFIGGSPGSCAGGIKTTTWAVWLRQILARAGGLSTVTLGRRRIPPEIAQRAGLVVGLSAVWCGLGVFLLSISESVGTATRLEQVIFEQVSAFATVGLSTGITPHLSLPGKLWIIASMFVGRVGPLTVALIALAPQARPRFEYPKEQVMIG